MTNKNLQTGKGNNPENPLISEKQIRNESLDMLENLMDENRDVLRRLKED